MHKKFIAFTTALALTFSLVACSSDNDKSNRRDRDDDKDSDVEEEVDESEEDHRPDYTLPEQEAHEIPLTTEGPYEIPSAYMAILSDAYGYLSSANDANVPEGFIGLMEVKNYEDDALNHIGYSFPDVDGNGIRELAISYVSDAEGIAPIYAMYSLSSPDASEATLLFEGSSRNAYFILENGHIFNTGSSGAAYSTNSSYEISDDGVSLRFIESYYTGFTDASQETWGYFHTTDINDIFSETHENSEFITGDYEEFENFISPTSDYFLTPLNLTDVTPISQFEG